MPKADIDKLVRSVLNRYKNPAPGAEEAWEGIGQTLEAMKKPSHGIPASILWMTALICICVGGGTGYFIGLNHSEKSSSALAKENSTQEIAASNNSTHSAIQETNISSSKENEINTDANTDSKGSASTASAITKHESHSSTSAFLSNNSSSASAYNNSLSNKNRAANNAFASANNESVIASSNSISTAASEETSDMQEFVLTNYFNAKGKPQFTAAEIETVPAMETSCDLNKKSEDHSKQVSVGQSIFYNIWNNPAYTGSEAKYNINTQARFVSFDKTYRPGTDYFMSFDSRIDKINSGVGVYAIRSISPSLATNTIGLTYSYKLKLTENAVLSFGTGLNVSNSVPYYESHYVNQKVVANSFLFIPNGEALASVNSRVTAADAGVWFDNKNFLTGLSVKNLNQPTYPESGKIPPHYIFTAGYKVNIIDNLQILPLVELHKIGNTYEQQVSLLLGFKKYFMAGLAYQNINPATPYGDLSLYASGQVLGGLRIFAGYGYTTANGDGSYRYKILQTGLRYQFR